MAKKSAPEGTETGKEKVKKQKSTSNSDENSTSKLFNLTDKDLEEDLPDVNDHEEILSSKKNPLEVKVSSETTSSPESKNTGVNTATGQNQTTPPVINETSNNNNQTPPVTPKAQVHDDDEISFTVPNGKESKSQTTQKQQTTTNQQQNNNAGQQQQQTQQQYQEPKYDGTQLDEDIWKISDHTKKTAPGGGGAGTTPPGGGTEGGIDIPDDDMNEAVDDLSTTALIIYESMILAGLKDRAKIDVPNFVGEMFALDIRHDYQQDYIRYIIQYNQQIDEDFKISPQKKAALKHAIKIILGKYAGFAESVPPEIQALLLIGDTLRKDYARSNRWVAPSKTLLSQMDDRLALTPKNSPPPPQNNTAQMGKTEDGQKKNPPSGGKKKAA